MKKLSIVFCIFLMESAYANVIFLNGSSSAGKSTIAHELQKSCPLYKIVSIDDVMVEIRRKFFRKYEPEAENVLFKIVDPSILMSLFTFFDDKKREKFFYENIKNPIDLQNAKEAAKKIKAIYKKHPIHTLSTQWKMTKAEMIKQTRKLALDGNTVIVDHIVIEPEHLKDFAKMLKNIPTLFVGVKAPFSVIKQREHQRGDRDLGTAKMVYKLTHAHKCYDLVLDTSKLTPRQAAVQVLIAMESKNGVFNNNKLLKSLNSFRTRARYTLLATKNYIKLGSRLIFSKL